MSPFYTRSGDGGSTGLLGEGRVPKYHPRMEALGALDEATATLGIARSQSQAAQTVSIVTEVQRDHNSFTRVLNKRIIFGSVLPATFRISSILTGLRFSGSHSSVSTETAITGSPN